MSKDNQTRTGFKPPLDSIASRKLPLKSTASCRAIIPSQPRALEHPRRSQAESQLEQQVYYLLLARRDVYNVWDQPPAIIYCGRTGKIRKHTFDFLVTFMDKRRVAVAVKPMSKVRSQGLVSELQLIRGYLPRTFADEVVLMTEQDFDRIDATNAQRLLDFRRHKDQFADDNILKLASELLGEVAIKDLIEQSKLGGRAFRAVFRAIYDGVLEQCRAGIIDTHTYVKVGEVVQ